MNKVTNPAAAATSAGTTPVSPPLKATHYPASCTLAESLARQYPPPALLWGHVLAAGERTMVSGPQKRANKTWFLCGLSISLATGREYLGLAIPNACRILYVNAEVGEDHFVERLRILTGALAADDPAAQERIRLIHLRGSGVDLTKREDQEWLIAEARAHHADVVIIDPITEAAPQTDENDPTSVLALLQGVQDMLANDGIAVVIAHHWAKGNTANGYSGGLKARGASKWPEHQDVNVQCHPNDDGSVTFGFETRNRRTPSPITAKLDEHCVMREIGTVFLPDTASRRSPNTDRLIDALRTGPMSQTALRLRLGISKGEVSKLVAQLKKGGQVSWPSAKHGRDKRGHPVQLVELVSSTGFQVSEENPDDE